MGRIAGWEINDFDADDEVALIEIEPGLTDSHRRAVHERHDWLPARKWRPFAVNMACVAGGAIATLLALGASTSMDRHAGGMPDGRMPTAERSAVAAAESSASTRSNETVAPGTDPIQRAIWNVLFGPVPIIDAFPDVNGLALAAYSAWAQHGTPVAP